MLSYIILPDYYLQNAVSKAFFYNSNVKHHFFIALLPNIRKSEHISDLEQKYNIVRRLHEFFQLLYVEGNSKVLL